VKDEQGGYSGRARNCTTGETSSVFYVALKIKLDRLGRVEYVCSPMTRPMHHSRSTPQIASAWVPVAVLPSAVPRARNIAPVPSLRYYSPSCICLWIHSSTISNHLTIIRSVGKSRCVRTCIITHLHNAIYIRQNDLAHMQQARRAPVRMRMYTFPQVSS
jgi:hypothetical protein